MIFEQAILDKVIDLGKLGYPVSKCVHILGLKGELAVEFEKQFFDQNSEVSKTYRIGVDLADFELDTKILQLAKSGDLKAVKEYDLRKKAYKLGEKELKASSVEDIEIEDADYSLISDSISKNDVIGVLYKYIWQPYVGKFSEKQPIDVKPAEFMKALEIITKLKGFDKETGEGLPDTINIELP